MLLCERALRDENLALFYASLILNQQRPPLAHNSEYSRMSGLRRNRHRQGHRRESLLISLIVFRGPEVREDLREILFAELRLFPKPNYEEPRSVSVGGGTRESSQLARNEEPMSTHLRSVCL